MSEQPKEYIITEKELYDILYPGSGYSSTRDKYRGEIASIVRSRPRPAPDYRELFIRDLLYNFRWEAEHGNPEFYKAVTMIKHEYLKPDSQLLKEHDAAIAAKARREERERLLEPMEDLRKFANGEYNEADASDNEREMRIHLEYENRIWDIMKSLREGAP